MSPTIRNIRACSTARRTRWSARASNLIRPKISEQLDYEGEIAIVIGRDCKHVPKEQRARRDRRHDAANEGTIRDWTRHGQFNVTQGKNFDATGGIGPWIETESI